MIWLGLIPTQAYTGRGETQASVTAGCPVGVDFGLVAPATIGDRVWDDGNGNGNGIDDGEPGIANVTVILTDANGGGCSYHHRRQR